MAKEVKQGQTDYTVLVFIPDPASTDGSGKTGLAHTDMTVSGTRVETDNDVVVTDYTASLNALSALTDAHNDWGWKEVSSTLAPGLYRLDIADAIFATGAWSAVVYVEITSSAAAASPIEFTLVPESPYTGVNVSMFNGTAATASAGRPEVNMTHIAGASVSTSTAQLGVNVVNFGGSAGTFASGRPETNMTHIAGSAVSTSTAQLGVNVVNFGGAAGTFASGRPEVNTSHVAGTAWASVDLTATMKTSVTTAATAATPVAASVTGNVGGNVTGSVGSVVGAVGSVTGNVGGNVTGSVGSIASGGITSASFAADSITASAIATDAIGSAEIASAAANKIADITIRRSLTTAEASSDGDSYTGRSLAGAISKLVNKVAVSGSTLTVYKSDDSTSSFTQTVTTDGTASPITAVDTV